MMIRVKNHRTGKREEIKLGFRSGLESVGFEAFGWVEVQGVENIIVDQESE